MAEKIADEARASLSEYCFSECKAFCCRHGFLEFTENESIVVAGDKRKELEDKKLLIKGPDNDFILNIGSHDQPCPRLINFRCTIHQNKERPKLCNDFPIFFWKDDVVFISPNCPAARENKLYPYLAELNRIGFKIMHERKK